MMSRQQQTKENTQAAYFPGLDEKQVQERLLRDGLNELSSTRPRSVPSKAWEVVSEPMFLLLISCGILYLVIGNTEDAFILLGSVCLIVTMSLSLIHILPIPPAAGF